MCVAHRNASTNLHNYNYGYFLKLLKEGKDVIVIGRPFHKLVILGIKEYMKDFV